MRRRLPSESEELLKQLAAWIAWRYEPSRKKLVLTSAPTSLPLELQRWKPGAVWRLVWQTDGAAILYGMAPGGEPRRYFVARHDGINPMREGLFDRLADNSWGSIQGDTLDLDNISEELQVA
jgi:hypothetical protein